MIKKRETWADVLKGIGAILVLVGHLVSYESKLKVYLYSFHMPLFFFISGYLFKYNDNLKEFIKKKAKTLLKPYFIYGILSMIVTFILFGIDMTKKEILLNLFFVEGKIIWNTSLWFLIIMFFVVTLFNLYIKVHKNKQISVIEKVLVLVLLFITNILLNKYQLKFYFGVEIIPHALFMFYLGYIYKTIPIRTNDKFKKISTNIITVTIISIIGILASYMISQTNQRVVMSNSQYGNYFIYLLVSLVGIYTYIKIAKKMLTAEEFIIFQNLPKSQMNAYLVGTWAKKEAAFKRGDRKMFIPQKIELTKEEALATTTIEDENYFLAISSNLLSVLTLQENVLL